VGKIYYSTVMSVQSRADSLQLWINMTKKCGNDFIHPIADGSTIKKLQPVARLGIKFTSRKQRVWGSHFVNDAQKLVEGVLGDPLYCPNA
jgi:hypothetical protein